MDAQLEKVSTISANMYEVWEGKKMRQIKNTFDHIDMEYFTIRDLAYTIKFGVLTLKDIPVELQDEVQQYLDDLPETE